VEFFPTLVQGLYDRPNKLSCCWHEKLHWRAPHEWPALW